MPQPENNNDTLTVGAIRVEPALNRVSHGEETLNLRPQVMELLVYLASHPAQVLSVEKLLDSLWAGKVVTEGTLYNCIGELRTAIASLDDTRPYIENIPRKGYRLSVEVDYPGEAPILPGTEHDGATRRQERSGTADSESGLRISGTVIFILAFVLSIAVAAFLYLDRPRDIRSVAVLPFEDNSPGGDQAYLGNGIADELRLELQRLDGLRVAGRTSSIAYAGEDSRTIGEALDVDAIIEGSVRQEEDSVRISVQLTNAADGFTIWSKSYNRSLDAIFEMQEDIATSVAGYLGVNLGVGSVNAFHGAGTRNVEAFEAYLKAQSDLYTGAGNLRAIPLLERAIELDPDYAAAWSALASRVYSLMWDDIDARALQLRDRSAELALRGVQLDPQSADANAVLGIVRMIQFDWIGAEQSFRTASELLADRATLNRYGVMLMRSGRLAEAQKKFEMATTLEPLGGRPAVLSWHASLAQGRIAEARERRYFDPGEDLFEDKLDLAFNDDDPEALKEAIEGLPGTNLSRIHLYGPLLAAIDSPERVLSLLREVYEDESVQWPRKLHDIAMAAVYFGDPAFALKVKAEDIHRNPSRLVAIWYPVMSDVRRLPAFKDLVIALNMVEYWRSYGWAEACSPLGDDDFQCS